MLIFLGTGMLDAPPALHVVPDLHGYSQASAVVLIEGSSYVASVQFGYNASFTTGTVYDQSPAAGTTLAPGSTITITVNVGLSPIYETVPYLIGATQDAAEVAIEAIHCTASVTGSSGTVTAQAPVAFSLVIRGSVIQITLGGDFNDGQGSGRQGLPSYQGRE